MPEVETSKETVIKLEQNNAENEPFEKFHCCSYCGKLCKTLESLTEHQKSHNTRAFQCEICRRKFGSEEKLQTHKKYSHSEGGIPENAFKCETCGKLFPHKYLLRYHEIAHNEKKFKCDFCDAKFKYKPGVAKHIMRKHVAKTENLDCPICNQTFDNRKSLLTHQRSHVEKTAECDLCQKKYSSMAHLNTHKRLAHSGDNNNLKCEQCDRFFPKVYYKIHLRSVHKLGPSECICDQCGKECITPGYLSLHKKSKHQGKIYECHLCDKTFTSDSGLRCHLKLHDPNTKYKLCMECGKKVLVTVYNAHMRRCHTAPEARNKFACDECGRSFFYKKSYEIHVRTHTGEKPFGCDECGKTFSCANTLKVHIRVHTKERPYVCDVCGKAFSQRTSLTNHRKTQH